MTKKIFFGVFAFLAFLLLFNFAEAAVTLVTPNSSNYVTGTYTFNASFTSFAQVTNCTVWALSASTANSSYVLLNSSFAVNTSTNAPSITGTFNSARVEDSNDYSVITSCRNITNVEQNSSAQTSVVFDNTIPDAPSSLNPATNTLVQSGATWSFNGTVSNPKTTSCTYIINRYQSSSDSKSASGSATYSSSTCSFSKTFSTSTDNGLYTYTITASDGTNTTTSSSIDVNVQIPGAGGGGSNNVQSTSIFSGNNSKTLLIVLLVVLIIFALSKKK